MFETLKELLAILGAFALIDIVCQKLFGYKWTHKIN